MKKIILALLIIPILILSQEISIQPYLQNLGSNSVTIMWESNSDSDNYIKWGENINFENTTYGTSQISELPYYIHTVTIENINPNTHYYYKAGQNNQNSNIYDFYTTALSSDEQSINIIAMSDMQIDSSNPNKFYEIIHDGVINYIQSQDGSINETIDMVLIPGDLVENGNVYETFLSHAYADAYEC